MAGAVMGEINTIEMIHHAVETAPASCDLAIALGELIGEIDDEE